jgi:hypothetical protein
MQSNPLIVNNNKNTMSRQRRARKMRAQEKITDGRAMADQSDNKEITGQPAEIAEFPSDLFTTANVMEVLVIVELRAPDLHCVF